MITPNEIAKKAQRKYPQYLASLVSGCSFFPLDFRFGTQKPKGDFHVFDRSRSVLLNKAKSPGRPGYSVELTLQTMRRYGEQRIPTRVFCETEDDYLAVIGKKQESIRFKKMLQVFRKDLPEILPWLEKHAHRLLPYLAVYPELLKVCLYFREHPLPGYYIRELPIEIHTKFIENHTGILKPMLEAILPEGAINNDATRFVPRFGLKEAPPLIRFRLISQKAKQIMPPDFYELALPINHFANLGVSGLNVVIIENLMTYLTWPENLGDLVIFGKGFQASLLRYNHHLHETSISYWGDLDVQGFTILSQLRSSFPHAQSLFMDQHTFDKHKEFVVEGVKSNVDVLQRLTPEETRLFIELKRTNQRLEQEHISLHYIKQNYISKT